MSNTSVSPNSILKYSAASLTSSVDGKSVTRRLQTELQMLMQSKAPGISAFPENDNLFRWIGTIAGPVTTVYEGLSFKLGIKFSSSYPYNPPSVVFESPIFHPNVDEQGNICLDILKDKWSAVYNAETILLSVQSLLGEPNTSSPLNGVAADLWSNPTEFKRVLWQKCNTQSSSSCS